MFIRDPPKTQTRKELKVHLSAKQHRTLRLLTVASGEDAPQIVTEALDLYFRRMAKEAADREARPVFPKLSGKL